MEFKKHVVKKGEFLSKIAKQYGYKGSSDWKKIYDHPKNAPLRKKRPNPDAIEPKDVIFIPAKPAKEIDDELAQLNGMLTQLKAMPPALKKIMMESKRMAKEAMRITKSGELIKQDIAMLRGMQAVHRAEITRIDVMAKASQKGGKKGAGSSAQAFEKFKQRQEQLAKLINTLNTIEDAEKHMLRDPQKAMHTMGSLGQDTVKIQKLTQEWTKAHADAVKDIEGRIKKLGAEKKQSL